MDSSDLAAAHEDSAASLRPVDLARQAGISPSLVRLYEQQGMLPPATRTPSGHRRYSRDHLQALLVARALRAGYGWEPAREVMRAVNRRDPDAALAITNERHAELHAESVRLTRALQAFDRAQPDEPEPSRRLQRSLSIGEAARQLAVTPATLRHWEAQQVIKPQRLSNGRRSYRPADLRRLELVQLLRSAGYSFANIAQLMADLTAQDSARTRRALDSRQQQLRRQTRAAVHATRALAGLLNL